MDFLPYAFLIVFVLLGGVIAVVADNLGRKVGKKRLSFGKLRPKHTATVITFLAGSLISLFTIVLITVVSADVRQWITEGRFAADKARQEKLVIEKELASKQHELESKEKEVEEQGAKLTKLQSQIGKLTPEIGRLTVAVTTANGRVDAIENSRKRAQSELVAKQGELTKEKALLVKGQDALKVVEEARKVQQQLATEAKNQKFETDRQNTELTQSNQQLEKNIAGLQTDIARLNTETTNLTSARDRAQKELKSAQSDLAQYQAQLVQTQNDLTTTEQQLKSAQQETNIIQMFNDRARTELPTYQVGEEVARVPVLSGLSARAAEMALDDLLVRAKRNAATRGAKASDKGPEAGIFEHFDSVTKNPITPDEIRGGIVTSITDKPVPVLLVARSSINSFKNEPVSLEIEVFPNPVVYTKGQVVAETKIDGAKDTDKIYQQIEDLFNVRVRNRAREDKMIPILGTDQFGEVEPNDIYNLINEVKAANRYVRVQAMALADTRAGDPLKLEFRIRL